MNRTFQIIILLITCSYFTVSAQLNCSVSCNQKNGWMPNGWGSYTITAENISKDTVVLKSWIMQWESEKNNNLHELNIKLAPGGEWKKLEYGYLSQETLEKAGKSNPKLVGKIHYKVGSKLKGSNLRVEIPASYLPEETKTIGGEKISISLMKSRFDQFSSLDRTMKWMELTYDAMEELTGGVPYEGKKVILKESPEHPFWAYAGQEIILNTKFVESTLNDFDNGILSFGWVHEIGHDFDDGIGEWYIWNGPAAEWQANFKLCYVIESISDQSFRIPQTVKVPNFPNPEKGKLLTGSIFSEKSFLYFGDKYLSDSSRSWESMSSDEMHSLFQRIQRMYGWEVYKKWYRQYRILVELGFSPPESNEDKINLMVGILSHECKSDLIPLFKTWKFPVSNDGVLKMKTKYNIGDEVCSMENQ